MICDLAKPDAIVSQYRNGVEDQRAGMPADRNGRLHHRVCVVAGALGAIGEGVARRLAEEDGIVVGIDGKSTAWARWRSRSTWTGKSRSGTATADYRELGRVDVICINAGMIDPSDRSAIETSLDVWERVMTGNLTTTYPSCKHGTPVMLRNDPAKGSVFNTASFLAGMGAVAGRTAFSARRPGCNDCPAIWARILLAAVRVMRSRSDRSIRRSLAHRSIGQAPTRLPAD